MIERKEKKAWTLLLSIAFMLLVVSCKDAFNAGDYEIKKVTSSPTLALPLASGDLFIDDLLSKVDKTNIKVASDGLVFLQYQQTLKSQSIRDLFVFPSRGFTKAVPIPPATLPATTTENVRATLTTTEDFAFTPEKLTEIKFKNTTVRVLVAFSPASPASSIFEVELRLPNFKLNGVSFQKRIPLGAGATIFALKDYVAVLANSTFPMEIVIYEKAHPSSVTITNPTSANVRIDFNTIDFQYIRGFFGDRVALNIPAESIALDAFGTALDKAKVSFAQPAISFSVSNDYGIPTKVTFSTLQARKSDGSSLDFSITPTPLPSTISINAPSNLGQSAITTVNVNNVKALIDFKPNQFYYKVTARINEGFTSASPPPTPNFCADTSKVRVTVKAEVPLYGKASGIVLADTFAIDLSAAKDTEVESGVIISKINNQLPLDAFVQLFITDANTIITDSLFTTSQTAIVKSSVVNAQGELVSAGVTDTEATIPKEKLKKLFDTKKMIVRIRMNTTRDASTQPDVKFKSTYKMNVVFGLKAKLKLAVDL